MNTTSDGDRSAKTALRALQGTLKPLGIQLRYSISQDDASVPHYRKVELRSAREAWNIWLDRGVDILRFEDLEKPIFKTPETYVLVERVT